MTEGPSCIPISFKIYATQALNTRLTREVKTLEAEMAKAEPEEEWVDMKIQAIKDARDTLEFINEMPTCDV